MAEPFMVAKSNKIYDTDDTSGMDLVATYYIVKQRNKSYTVFYKDDYSNKPKPYGNYDSLEKAMNMANEFSLAAFNTEISWEIFSNRFDYLGK